MPTNTHLCYIRLTFKGLPVNSSRSGARDLSLIQINSFFLINTCVCQENFLVRQLTGVDWFDPGRGGGPNRSIPGPPGLRPADGRKVKSHGPFSADSP